MGYALIHHPSNSCESSIWDNLTLQLQKNTPDVPILGLFVCFPHLPPTSFLLPNSRANAPRFSLPWPVGALSYVTCRVACPSLRDMPTFGLAGGAWKLWDWSPALEGPTSLRLTMPESSIQERVLKTDLVASMLISSHPNTPYLFDEVPCN